MRGIVKYMICWLRLGPVARQLRKVFWQAIDSSIGWMMPHQRGCALDTGTVKKILLIRRDAIGDVILTTPALRAVRHAFPHALIHLLVSEQCRDLVSANPNIDRLLIDHHDRIEGDYDCAIAFHAGYAHNRITHESGARVRVGFRGSGGSFFLTHALDDDRATRIRHEVDSALEAVAVIGCRVDDKQSEVSVTEAGERFAVRFFRDARVSVNRPVVVMHPGARQAYVRWKKEGFAEVADTLIREYEAAVIFTGSDGERRLVEEIISLMAQKAVSAAGIRLTETVSLIKRCSLYVGNVTGPMHIAAALEVPVVAIFGCAHPLDSCQVWGPRGPKAAIVTSAIHCPSCHPTDCRRQYACMQAITADEVLSAARRLLATEAYTCTRKS